MSDTRSIGLLRYGVEYFASARVIHEKLSEKPFYNGVYEMPMQMAPEVAYFLLGHAIELCLKAVALNIDPSIDENFLRHKMGHDLSRCIGIIRARCSIFLEIWDDEDEAYVDILNCVYMRKEFEYIRTGNTVRADYNRIELATAKLFNAARVKITPSAFIFNGKYGEVLAPAFAGLNRANLPPV